MSLKIGLKAEKKVIVNNENTAEKIGSGSLPVFATPALIALMEASAIKAIETYLEETTTTVGILINVQHLAATPLNLEITATAELVNIENKKLTFKVSASDKKGIIGEGYHERFIVDVDKFMAKTLEKIN